MTAKDYLSQAYRIDQSINSKIEQIQSLRALALKASSVLAPTPVSGTRSVHRLEEIVTKIADMEDEINADIDNLVDLKHEISVAIKAVPSPEHRLLLELRYLCFKDWTGISSELNLDMRWVHRLHNRALKEIEEIRHSRPLKAT